MLTNSESPMSSIKVVEAPDGETSHPRAGKRGGSLLQPPCACVPLGAADADLMSLQPRPCRRLERGRRGGASRQSFRGGFFMPAFARTHVRARPSPLPLPCPPRTSVTALR